MPINHALLEQITTAAGAAHSIYKKIEELLESFARGKPTLPEEQNKLTLQHYAQLKVVANTLLGLVVSISAEDTPEEIMDEIGKQVVVYSLPETRAAHRMQLFIKADAARTERASARLQLMIANILKQQEAQAAILLSPAQPLPTAMLTPEVIVAPPPEAGMHRRSPPILNPTPSQKKPSPPDLWIATGFFLGLISGAMCCVGIMAAFIWTGAVIPIVTKLLILAFSGLGFMVLGTAAGAVAKLITVWRSPKQDGDGQEDDQARISVLAAPPAHHPSPLAYTLANGANLVEVAIPSLKQGSH